MSWFTENPWPIVWFGVLAELVLIGVWRTTRQQRVFYVMGGVAALVVTCLIVEMLVVTEYEEIESTLHEAAEAIEAGDVEAVLAFLAPPPEAENIRQIVRQYLPAYAVREFTFDKPQVTFTDGEGGRRYAEIKVWFKVFLEDPNQANGRDMIPYAARFTARKTDGRWLLIEFRPELGGARL